jgi:hypothetical protein
VPLQTTPVVIQKHCEIEAGMTTKNVTIGTSSIRNARW